MEREKRILYFEKICNKLLEKDVNKIEKTLIEYIKIKSGANKLKNASIDMEIYEIFIKEEFPADIEYIIEFFEYLLDKDQKNENGIVFTPKYISDFIVRDSLKDLNVWDKNVKIIDPGCGCGIFLISAIEYIHNKFNIDIQEIIEENIYGIDIMEDNIRRCKYAIELYCIMNNMKLKNSIKFNLTSKDSLKENWNNLFNVEKFNYIIGNPPYVNSHDMKKETIKSASTLREILQDGRNIESIIDFYENMIFKPVIRTYNCIIKLNKKGNERFKYAVLDKCEDVEKKIGNIDYQYMASSLLDKNGWKLVSRKTLSNIRKIEKQKTSIKEFIRTGIATLKDGVYIVDCDEKGFYKNIDGARFDIESDIVKPIYKIPELKKCENENDAMQYIIFPYYKCNGIYKLIEEEEFEQKYPNTYKYLEKMKNVLDKRDKGKKNPYGWYAYGRTQGLNKYGKKMLFPTFAKDPKFRYIENENALFCNGYAIFENDKISLNVLEKILNSDLMKYYISNTSYVIEGGYYCYQKKYIEKFSVPEFNDNELEILNGENKEQINEMLFNKYNITI